MRKHNNNNAEKTTIVSPASAPIVQSARTLLATLYPADRIEQAFSVLDGLCNAVPREKAATLDEPTRIEPCYTRPELAKLLKCDVRNIDYHRRAGHLVPVYISGSSRCRGFTAESVRAMLCGKTTKGVK